jgi:rare lipoprotein A
VTNRNNGGWLIVMVHDRGPFVDDRLIDLSYAAATELDMIRDGTAPVLVRALGAPARFSEVSDSGYSDSRYVDSEGTREVSTLAGITRGGTASTAVVPGSTVGTFLQVGAFSARRNAENLLRRLEANGVDNAFVLSDSSGAGNLYRVRVGPLVDSVQLDDTMTSLQRIGIGDAHLVIGR